MTTGTDPRFNICLGTINAGLWVSGDAGATWQPSRVEGLYAGECNVRAVASSTVPGVVWATAEVGPGSTCVLRSDDGGLRFRIVGETLGVELWALACSPFDSETLVAGTRPAGLLRSDDGGGTWTALPTGAPGECRIGRTRITSIVFGRSANEIFAGVEIGGVLHTTDDGRTWQRHALAGGEELMFAGEVWLDERHEDIHALALNRCGLSVATPIGYFRSSDGLDRWFATRFRGEQTYDPTLFYSRSLYAPAPDGATVLLGVGLRPPDHGVAGGIYRSSDCGRTWRSVTPVLSSVVWAMAGLPQEPHVAAAATLYGQVLVTTDAGETWQLARRQFGETRTIAVTAA